MANVATRCSHCEAAIVDPTTQVVHGDQTFCCPNCAHAMEQGGSGSDPYALESSGEVRCAHCGVEIVHDDTMMEREGSVFCCANCAAMVGTGAATG